MYAAMLAKGDPLPNVVVGGYDNDMVCNWPYGAGATPEVIKAADAGIADLKAKTPIYVGPLKDNTGKAVLDKTFDNHDPVLDGMNYRLEGVVGSVTLLDDTYANRNVGLALSPLHVRLHNGSSSRRRPGTVQAHARGVSCDARKHRYLGGCRPTPG